MNKPSGAVSRKMRYLGAAFPGQDLCWCEIDVFINTITVTRYRWERERQRTEYPATSERGVYIRSKLRDYFYRKGKVYRWRELRLPGCVRFVIYYPSTTWGHKLGIIRFLLEGAF